MTSRRGKLTPSEILQRICDIDSEESGDDNFSSEDEADIVHSRLEMIEDDNDNQSSDSDADESQLDTGSTNTSISNTFLSKDRSVSWATSVSGQLRLAGRNASHNVFKANPGLKFQPTRCIVTNSKVSAFECLFDSSMVRTIVECTNKEAQRQLNSNSWETNFEEIRGFIGLVLIRGASVSSKVKVNDLWSSGILGLPIFKRTMSRKRFKDILRFIRFDDKNSRSDRLKNDKFAHISTLWDRFVTNAQNCYVPHENLTVDEQLMPCKTRCPYTQYMANKPDKFGLKFWLLNEVDTKYLLNAIPYLGKSECRPPNIQLGHHVVRKLVQPFTNKGYNITADNFFSSISLAKDLLKQKFSYVGTMRHNRKELPGNILQIEKNMQRFSTLFLMNDDASCSLMIYKCKPNKAALLLTTRHHSINLLESHPKKLPDCYDFYNHTKVGVDSFDQMTRIYTTRAGTRRWTMSVFYNLLDFCGINSWILFRLKTGQAIPRRDFLLSVGEEFCNLFVGTSPIDDHIFLRVSTSQNNRKRRQCQIEKHKNRSYDECISCSKVCCGQCTSARKVIVQCKNCMEKL